ncbi:MAG: hypothetical protein JXL97_13520 [Bacteroidales bacterium]|nr:hypothetical protein [Bacteroidales bacterium]
MFRETFGLTTGNFVKLFILAAFIFFFVRLVNLAILFVKGEHRKELRNLFIFTELILWALIAVWIYNSVPANKILLTILLVAFSAINFGVWRYVRQRLAGVIYNRVYNPKKNNPIKIGNEIYIIESLFLNDFDVSVDGNTKKFNYLEAIKLGTVNFIQSDFSLTIDEKSEFQSYDKLLEILKEHNFLNNNTTVEVEKTETNWNIIIKSFNQSNINEIKEFIKQIV